MSTLEYHARAVGITDTENGKKVLVFRTECNRTVKVFCDPNQSYFVVKELNHTEEPIA